MYRLLTMLFSLLIVVSMNYADDSSGQDDMVNEANALFKKGKFTEAKALYSKIVATTFDHYDAILALGKI
ncbi:MAG: hypothetical protein JSU64_04070, partial [candidate division WOR-3 bacterium]